MRAITTQEQRDDCIVNTMSFIDGELASFTVELGDMPSKRIPPLPRKARGGWTCPYCGRSHPNSRSYCKDGTHGCGASRPIKQ